LNLKIITILSYIRERRFSANRTNTFFFSRY